MTANACRQITTSRRLPAAATALVVLAALLWPVPAAADVVSVDTWTGLQEVLNPCDGTLEDPTMVTLSDDITSPSGGLTVACVAELDLSGHELTVTNVVINTGQQLTIDDGSGGGGTLTTGPGASGTAGIRTTGAALIIHGGTVTATGGSNAAGIGGNDGGVAGSVTISGGEVTATGMGAAGIGGGHNGAGGPVTISGGRVVATGGSSAAGIGSGFQASGGPVTISGGDVTATGGGSAAGIGSGREGAASGTVIISGGEVTATGSYFGAGIGGGLYARGGSVTISGGEVAATGGLDAAGIGGGYGGHGGAVDVGPAAVVTAIGGHTAIGAGLPSFGGLSFGSLAVSGRLHLPAGNLHIPGGIVVNVADGGQILGSAEDSTVGANVLGGGRIANGGVIALDASHVTGDGVIVSGHHYEVAFDADGGSPTPDEVTVFASSFEDGHRIFPTDPTRGRDEFRGWTDLPDGAGTPITATSVLPGSSADGTAVAITASAFWEMAPQRAADATTSTVTAAPTSISANGTSTSTITVQAKDANGDNLTDGGDAVTLATTAGTLSVVTDVGDGTYTAVLTSATTAGAAIVSGTLNTVALTGTATVNFTAVSSSTPTPTGPEPDGPEPDAPDVPDFEFEDVSGDSVHAEATYRMRQYGITIGNGGTTFDPSGDLSRHQMSTFMVRLLMLTDSSIEQPADHEAAIALLVDRGLLLGDAKSNFNGAGTLPRGQAASLLARLVEDVTGEALTARDLEFSDVATTHAHAGNIAKLVESGVIHGYADNTFRSGTELRRDQMASLISRTIDVLIASGNIEDLDA